MTRVIRARKKFSPPHDPAKAARGKLSCLKHYCIIAVSIFLCGPRHLAPSAEGISRSWAISSGILPFREARSDGDAASWQEIMTSRFSLFAWHEHVVHPFGLLQA
ncbi:hypothetical protein BDW75DRAFT_202027 [Aspergillus navahoensis]